MTATITPPKNLDANKPMSISADVAWLVCEKVCLPGKATVTLDFPTTANADLFAAWKDRGDVILAGSSVADITEQLEDSQASLIQMLTQRQSDPASGAGHHNHPVLDRAHQRML